MFLQSQEHSEECRESTAIAPSLARIAGGVSADTNYKH